MASKETLTRYARYVHFVSAIVGVVGAVGLYETAEHGGELVYSYAGGPGLRAGDPRDTERLLLAGLYNQSQVDRKAGRHAEAGALVNMMLRRFPNDTTVRLLHVESLLLDNTANRAALAAVDSISISPSSARLRARHATLKADVYLALGLPDSARTMLAPVVAAFPQNARLKARLDAIKLQRHVPPARLPLPLQWPHRQMNSNFKKW